MHCREDESLENKAARAKKQSGSGRLRDATCDGTSARVGSCDRPVAFRSECRGRTAAGPARAERGGRFESAEAGGIRTPAVFLGFGLGEFGKGTGYRRSNPGRAEQGSRAHGGAEDPLCAGGGAAGAGPRGKRFDRCGGRGASGKSFSSRSPKSPPLNS